MQQRIGVRGENAFRVFAERQGLVPSKFEEDFGTDFFCQVDQDHRSAGTSTMGGAVILACVRSTVSAARTVRLTRKDAEHLLMAGPSTFVALVCLVDDVPEIHHCVVDEHLVPRLRRFLADPSRAKLTLSTRDCLPESEFPGSLRRMCDPQFREKVTLAVATAGMSAGVPEVRIQIHRTAEGELTLITAFDFFDFFDRLEPGDQRKVFEAAFGAPSLRAGRLVRLALDRGVVDNLDVLPEPYILGGGVAVEDATLRLGDEHDGAECNVERLSIGERYGWVHPAGVGITVSRRTYVDGRWIHRTEAFFDPDVATSLADAPQLANFLAHATEDAELSDGRGFVLEATYFDHLMTAGQMCRSAALLAQLPGWRDDLLFFRDVTDEEVLASVGLLSRLADDAQALNFVRLELLCDEPGGAPPGTTPAARVAELEIPFVVNFSTSAVVATSRCGGRIGLDDDGDVVSFAVDEVRETSLRVLERLDKATPYPELCLGRGGVGVAFPDTTSLVRSTLPREVHDLGVRVVGLAQV